MVKYPVHMDWKNYIVKMSVLLSGNSYSAIPIKSPIAFLIKIEKNPKIHMIPQKIMNSQNNLE